MAEKKGSYTVPVNSESPTTKKNSPQKTSTKIIAEKTNKKKKKNINEQNEHDIVVDTENTSYLVKQLINSASDNLGVGYKGGGTTKNGFDCSGLMYSTFKIFDILLPRSSHEMAQVGRKLDTNEIKKGDLIFFKTNGKSRINHVGMVVEMDNDEIKFIHSSTQSGVIISSTKESYYKRTFAQANRILN